MDVVRTSIKLNIIMRMSNVCSLKGHNNPEPYLINQEVRVNHVLYLTLLEHSHLYHRFDN